MSPEEIERAFAQLDYDGDDRRAPDERRRGRFRAGWEDAVKRHQVYTEETLKRLTWHNLGYRFGRRFGDTSAEQIDSVYEHLAVLWESIWGPTAEGRGSAAPSAEQYMAAFRKLESITDSQVQMLRLHYNAPERTITATEMAHAVGYSHYSIANSQYGRLGRLVGERLDYNPMKERLGTLVTFEKRESEWHWIMRPQVAEALERLDWVEGAAILLPEEIVAAATPLVEGAVCRVTVNAYERNPHARRRCIEAHGTACAICGFSFGEAYGDVAEGFIHVHHLRPLSDIGREYTVDPIEDLRPVCPNCHAVLHRRIPAYSIEEVRIFLGGRIVRAISANHPPHRTVGGHDGFPGSTALQPPAPVSYAVRRRRSVCQGTSTFSQLGDTNCYAGSRQLQTVWSPELASLPPSSSGSPSLRPHLVPAPVGPGSLAAHRGCGTLACRAKQRRALLASNLTKG